MRVVLEILVAIALISFAWKVPYSERLNLKTAPDLERAETETPASTPESGIPEKVEPTPVPTPTPRDTSWMWKRDGPLASPAEAPTQ